MSLKYHYHVSVIHWLFHLTFPISVIWFGWQEHFALAMSPNQLQSPSDTLNLLIDDMEKCNGANGVRDLPLNSTSYFLS